MWKVTGKTIFPRWHTIKRTAAKCRKSKNEVKVSGLSSFSSEEKGSHGNSGSKQHAKKEQHKFWDDPEHQCNLLRCNLLETVSLVGTAAICLDVQHKLWSCSRRPFENESQKCLFSKVVSAMPYTTKCKVIPEQNVSKVYKTEEQLEKKPATISSNESCRSFDSIVKDIDKLTADSIASIDNYFGIMFSKTDNKHAFDFFKASAQLDCPKGLFNLALCYEKGFGTKVDLKKAAQYYKLAASKDHPFALYNLGVYFIQGLGGIGRDFEQGLKLVEKAADLNVPEAQLYLGVRNLENKKWSEAYTLFSAAAKQNNIDAQYFLGVCYENGYGVPKNKIEADNMYSIAAKNGQEDAILKLSSSENSIIGGIDKDEDFSMLLYNMIKDRKKSKKSAKKATPEKPVSSLKVPEPVLLNGKLNNPPQDVPTVLHSSSSVPELREYFSRSGNLNNSRSCSISFLCTVNTEHMKFHVASGDINSSLDLAMKNPPSSQLAMPYFVAASS